MTESLPRRAPRGHRWTLTVCKPPEKHSHFRYRAPAGENRRAWGIRPGLYSPGDSRMGLAVGSRGASGWAEVQERCLTHAVPRGPHGVHVHCWPTSVTLNVSITTALLSLVNKRLKRVGWYGVAPAGMRTFPGRAQSTERTRVLPHCALWNSGGAELYCTCFTTPEDTRWGGEKHYQGKTNTESHRKPCLGRMRDCLSKIKLKRNHGYQFRSS